MSLGRVFVEHDYRNMGIMTQMLNENDFNNYNLKKLKT